MKFRRVQANKGMQPKRANGQHWAPKLYCATSLCQLLQRQRQAGVSSLTACHRASPKLGREKSHLISNTDKQSMFGSVTTSLCQGRKILEANGSNYNCRQILVHANMYRSYVNVSSYVTDFKTVQVGDIYIYPAIFTSKPQGTSIPHTSCCGAETAQLCIRR